MFECARAKTARKSWDLLHRIYWVTPEIYIWRTPLLGWSTCNKFYIITKLNSYYLQGGWGFCCIDSQSTANSTGWPLHGWFIFCTKKNHHLLGSPRFWPILMHWSLTEGYIIQNPTPRKMKIISKQAIQKNTLTRFWPFLTKLDSLWTTYLNNHPFLTTFWMVLKLREVVIEGVACQLPSS